MAPHNAWTKQEEDLLLSLLHRDLWGNGYVGRRRWRDIAQDMAVEGTRLEIKNRPYPANSLYCRFKDRLQIHYHEERRAIIGASSAHAINFPKNMEINDNRLEDSQVNFADFLNFEESTKTSYLAVSQTRPTT
jgi:hypothetical protein